MRISLKHCLPAVICLLSLITVYVFRTVPQSQLWKGWTLFYVSSDAVSEADVLSTLAEAGCTGVITKSQQREPVVSPLSPLQAVAENSYLERRNAFFSDAHKKTLVFYVPENEASALSHAIQVLEQAGVRCGTDSAVAFPYLAPLFCLLLAGGAVAFSPRRRRLYMAVSSVFLLALAFSRPLFTVSASVSIAIIGLCVLLTVYGRRGYVRRISRSPVAVLLLAVPFFVLCASNLLHALLFLLALAAAVSSLLLIDEARALYYSRFEHAFLPVCIRSAHGVSLLVARNVYALFSLTVTCVLLLCASLFGGSVQSAGTATDRPALPAPVSRSDGILPDLDDFMAWSWKTASFPYKKLSENAKTAATPEYYPEEGEVVSVSTFTEQAGRIVTSEEPKLVFNSAFREGVYDAVKKSTYPSLEQMMLKQGKNARYAYVRGGSRTQERLGTMLLLFSATVSAGITLYFVLGRRRYGFSN